MLYCRSCSSALPRLKLNSRNSTTVQHSETDRRASPVILNNNADDLDVKIEWRPRNSKVITSF